MHPGVITEVQKVAFLHCVLTTTLCHQEQNGGPDSELQFKKSTSVFHTSIFNVGFQNLKNKYILNIGIDPLANDLIIINNTVQPLMCSLALFVPCWDFLHVHFLKNSRNLGNTLYFIFYISKHVG